MPNASSPTLLCYDGSSSAKHALEVTGETVASESIVLLNVWSAPVEALADSYTDPGLPAGASMAELEDQEATRATEVANEGVEHARRAGLNATVTVNVQRAEGDEWRTILDVADAIDAGLIVMGTRGHTAVQEGLLGTSVSSDVLRHSLRPVLVVPAPQATHAESHSGAGQAQATR